ncbi:MAG TPA: hypothetical protein VKG61_15525 [Streptosporangiaceae bacterium]|nr:hypothetical protein [Streptosporangiaceae bacterium]
MPAALAGSLVLAAITGAIRAMTVRVWVEASQALRQGTWITALLWVVSLDAHLGYDFQAEAQRIADGPRQDVGDPGTRAPSW